MRKLREILRLQAEGVSERQIAVAIGVVRSTVQLCLRRARDAGIDWSLAEALTESEFNERLYRREAPSAFGTTRPLPDFAKLNAELARPGVTRLLLWQEYKACHPDGWQ